MFLVIFDLVFSLSMFYLYNVECNRTLRLLFFAIVCHFCQTLFPTFSGFSLSLFCLDDLDIWLGSLSDRSHILKLSNKSLSLEFTEVERSFLWRIVWQDLTPSLALIKPLAFPFNWFRLNLQIRKLKYWIIIKSILYPNSITWLHVIPWGNESH